MPNTDAPSRLEPGQIVGDAYRVHRLLGEHTLSTSYLAEDLRPRAVGEVVLRVPDAALLLDTSNRLAFLREVLAPTRMPYQGIVAVFDLGPTRDGGLFVARRYVAGPTLAEEMATPEASGTGIQTLVLAWTVASILNRAHHRGIFHGALKPSNIVLTKGDPEAASATDIGLKLIDFGVSQLPRRAPSEAGRSLPITHNAAQPGTDSDEERAYEAPEHRPSGLLGYGLKEPTAEADIYSLGVLFYRLLGGPLRKGRAGAEDKPAGVRLAEDLERTAPALPPGIPALLAQMVDEKPKRRPSAEQVKNVLDKVLGLTPR